MIRPALAAALALLVCHCPAVSGAALRGGQIPAAYETQRVTAPAQQPLQGVSGGRGGQGGPQRDFQQMSEVAGRDPQSAIQMLKEAAREIRAKFREAQGNPKFGIGMRRRTLKRIVKESEEFWDFLENIDRAQDVESWSPSDAEDLQILIAQVAQMDDDLSDPSTTNRAKKEYRAIVREFKEAGISPSG